MLPSLHFLKDFSGRSNAAGFFSNECFAKFNLLATKEDVLVFNNDVISEYLLSAFEESKTEKPIVWQQLISLSDKLPLDAKLRKQFSELVETYEFESNWQENEKSALLILRFIADQKELLSEEQTSKIKKWLKFVVSELAVKYTNKQNRLFADK